MSSIQDCGNHACERFHLPSRLDGEVDCDWTGLKFSPDGRYILITTNGSVIRLIDAFDGHIKHNLKGHVNEVGDPLEACFSPDSHYIFSGMFEKKI